ncbi:prolipoprotein diacylglyceryl transferase family protein [Candidatus Oscillochloris fontis]|uniref:prolipoprotein diacylglyceryl transferase family protein n=1 Tax=Candidatus Oscillochloris fontis TaxID=2496868 RepID=UPI00101C1F89|nr:prolipoprotein diacylglyceryl transferase family protein [Candidatus Oscillochloris fontis]
MLPFIQLGPLAINTPGLLLLIGFWLAVWLVEREGDQLGLRGTALSGALMVGLVGGLIAARLAFAAAAPAAYLEEPLALLAPTLSALDLPFGLFIGILLLLFDTQRRQIVLRPALDALAPTLPLMALSLALAQLAGGDAYGAAANLPWSIYLWEEWRHPTQIYAAVAALITLALWWRTRSAPLAPASRLPLVIGALALAQIGIEGLRGDSALVLAGLRTGQVVGFGVLAGCLWIIPKLQPAKA